MHIQLKQTEIESAIKNYLGEQGIAVTGRDINMVFTSGRKNNGLSVEVVIDDITTERRHELKNRMPSPLPSTAEATVEVAAGADTATAANEEVPAAPVGSLFGG